MTKRPTIRDIAAKVGLSKTTVAYVLNKCMDVAIPDTTRDRVIEAAKELGYRPNSFAKSFSTGKSRNVGVVVSYQGYVNGYQDAFVSRILFGLQESCAADRYGVLLAAAQSTGDDVIRQVDSLLEQRIAGLVMIGNLSNAQVERLTAVVSEEAIACVITDDRCAAGRFHTIATDDCAGAQMAVEHLIKSGRRRIAHLTAGTSTTTARDRRTGYETALVNAGIGVDNRLVGHGSFSHSQALDAAARILGQSIALEAVFADSDYLALAVIQAASMRGMRIPDDVALVGYGDLQVAEWLNLTTVRQHPEEIGKKSAKALFDQMADYTCRVGDIMLPVELVVRSSCGCGKIGE